MSLKTKLRNVVKVSVERLKMARTSNNKFTSDPQIQDIPKKKILFANSVPAFKNSTILDSILAEYFQCRGHDVYVSVCDGVLAACLNCKYGNLNGPFSLENDTWRDHESTCVRCRANAVQFKEINKELINFSRFNDSTSVKEFEASIQHMDPESLRAIKAHGVALYEHARAGTIRFFAKGRPEDEPNYHIVFRRYLVAAYQTANIFASLFSQFKPDVVVAHHGIYVPQGIIVDLAKAQGIRVVTWTPSYRRGTFMFCEGDTYHKVMPSHCPQMRKLSADEDIKILEYIRSRAQASSDWIWFNKNSEKTKTNIREQYKIAPGAKIVALYTNVFWDAQLHFDDAIYLDMLDWLEDTIRIFEKMKNVHLLIRAHPAEVSGFVPSRQRVDHMLEDMVKHSPNISIIASDDTQCSYALADASNFTIVYGSKIAIELAAIGKKVIVCGEAWAKGKGFTFDIQHRTQYQPMVEAFLSESDELGAERIADARSYASWFFFQKMMPIELINPTGDKAQPYVRKRDVNLVNISQAPGLSALVNGILLGTQFELPTPDYPSSLV